MTSRSFLVLLSLISLGLGFSSYSADDASSAQAAHFSYLQSLLPYNLSLDLRHSRVMVSAKEGSTKPFAIAEAEQLTPVFSADKSFDLLVYNLGRGRILLASGYATLAIIEVPNNINFDQIELVAIGGRRIILLKENGKQSEVVRAIYQVDELDALWNLTASLNKIVDDTKTVKLALASGLESWGESTAIVLNIIKSTGERKTDTHINPLYQTSYFPKAEDLKRQQDQEAGQMPPSEFEMQPRDRPQPVVLRYENPERLKSTFMQNVFIAIYKDGRVSVVQESRTGEYVPRFVLPFKLSARAVESDKSVRLMGDRIFVRDPDANIQEAPFSLRAFITANNSKRFSQQMCGNLFVP